jgi:polar amino acid transport system substrate-binding protein
MTHAIRTTLQKAILFMVVLLVPPAAIAETVTLATHELYPYGYHDSANNFTGYAVERVRFATARCGYNLELLVLPWPRAQALAKTDSVDGFFAGSLNDERKTLYVASAVLAPQNWTWYMLRNTPLTPDSPSFKKKAKVGSFIGANMLTYLEQNGFNIAGTPKDTSGLFHMLLGKRLDAILANELVARKLIEEQGIDPVVRSQILKSEPLHALFTQRFIRENPNFLESFNAALAEFEARHHSNR